MRHERAAHHCSRGDALALTGAAEPPDAGPLCGSDARAAAGCAERAGLDEVAAASCVCAGFGAGPVGSGSIMLTGGIVFADGKYHRDKTRGGGFDGGVCTLSGFADACGVAALAGGAGAAAVCVRPSQLAA